MARLRDSDSKADVVQFRAAPKDQDQRFESSTWLRFWELVKPGISEKVRLANRALKAKVEIDEAKASEIEAKALEIEAKVLEIEAITIRTIAEARKTLAETDRTIAETELLHRVEQAELHDISERANPPPVYHEEEFNAQFRRFRKKLEEEEQQNGLRIEFVRKKKFRPDEDSD